MHIEIFTQAVRNILLIDFVTVVKGILGLNNQFKSKAAVVEHLFIFYFVLFFIFIEKKEIYFNSNFMSFDALATRYYILIN